MQTSRKLCRVLIGIVLLHNWVGGRAGAQCVLNSPQATLNNPVPAADDYFGPVAISGNLAVVGAPADDPGGALNAGTAYVFDATTGALVSTLNNPTPDVADGFGWNVAISGNLAVVGMSKLGGAAKGTETAYVFDATTGALIATLNKPEPTPDDRFAFSVAISGNLAVVGAELDHPGGVGGAGTAYVFNATTGALIATLNKPEPMVNDLFGSSVAISGNLAVVAASQDSSGGVTNAGAAFVFDATTGALIVILNNPAPTTNGYFGSVAISGNLAVVGAAYDDPSGVSNAGTAYVFNAMTGALISTINNPDLGAGDLFGNTIAISGNLVVAGASYDDPGGVSNAGTAYVFNAMTGALISTLNNPNPAASDNFGWVAISGNLVAVGASGDDPTGVANAGTAYVFGCPPPSPTPSPTGPTPTQSPSPTPYISPSRTPAPSRTPSPSPTATPTPSPSPSPFLAVWHVKTTGNDVNTGTSWDQAFQTIRRALQAAQNGNQIWVAEGTYLENPNIPAGVEVYGGFAGNEISLSQRDWAAHVTTIFGEQWDFITCSPIVYVVHNFGITDGFSITGGSTGIVNRFGGVVRNCRIYGNCGDDPYAAGDRYLEAGGVTNSGTLINSFIYNNCIDAYYNFYSGGVANFETGVVVNCSIMANGPAPYFYADPIPAGGLYNLGLVVNSIIWNNIESDLAGPGTAQYSIFPGGAPPNLNADPLFWSSSNPWDAHLRPNSPAIDTGTNATPFLAALDLDHRPRVIDGNLDSTPVVDMGAYEYVPPVSTPTPSPSPSSTPTPTPIPCIYLLSPRESDFPALGGAGSVTVSTSEGCDWTATASDPSWIVIQNPAGNGPGVVNYTILQNAGQMRQGVITVGNPPTPISTGGQVHVIRQCGALPPNAKLTARIKGIGIPKAMTPNQSVHVSFTVTNRGNVSWMTECGFRLGKVNPADPFGPDRIDLPPGVSVAPGQSWTFEADFTAPAAPGIYKTQWRMLQEGNTWFGRSLQKRIRVVSPQQSLRELFSPSPDEETDEKEK